jgi:hypothetical protein
MQRLAIALWVLATPAAAAADPCQGVYSDDGLGGTLVGLAQNDDIRMVGEQVVFLQPDAPPTAASAEAASAETRWRVRASYVFENLTDRAIDLAMVFPMEVLRPDCEIYFSEHVPHGESLPEEPPDGGWSRYPATPPIPASDFYVTVDGRPVASTLERQIRPAAGYYYPFGYSFPVSFAPRARRELNCEYLQATSATYEEVGIEESDEPPYERAVHDNRTVVPFVLATGRLWAGTLERLDLFYRFAEPIREIWYDETEIEPGSGALEGEHFEVFRWELGCKDGKSELRIRARDVDPWVDLVLGYHPGSRWDQCADGRVAAVTSAAEGDTLEDGQAGTTSGGAAADEGGTPAPDGGSNPDTAATEPGATTPAGPDAGTATPGPPPEPPATVPPRQGAGCACAVAVPPGAGPGAGWPLVPAAWGMFRFVRRRRRPTTEPPGTAGQGAPIFVRRGVGAVLLIACRGPARPP